MHEQRRAEDDVGAVTVVIPSEAAVIPRSEATRDLDPGETMLPRPRSLASLGMTDSLEMTIVGELRPQPADQLPQLRRA